MRLRSKIILLLAVLIAIAIFCVLAFSRSTPVERCEKAMKSAFASRRLVEARLSGDVVAAKYQPRTSSEDRLDIDENKLKAAYEAVVENPEDVAVQKARARLLIADGKVEEALNYLRKVVQARQEDAEVHNDLGVCFFASKHLEDAAREFDKAVSYNPNLVAARFNRALCYQRLKLRNKAAEEFAEAEKLEKDKSWLKEIEKGKSETSAILEDVNEATMRRDAVAKFRDAASEGSDAMAAVANDYFEYLLGHARGRLYTAWLLPEKVKDDSRWSPRDEMRMVGTALRDAKGDEMILDLWTYLSTLSDSARAIEADVRSKLLEIDYRANRNDTAETISAIRPLATRLKEQGNKVAFATLMARIINYEYAHTKAAEASTDIAEIQVIVDQAKWPWLQSSLRNSTAQVLAVKGQDLAAIDYCQKAIAGYERLGLVAPQAKVLQTSAWARQRLGDRDGAIDEYRRSTEMFTNSETRLGEMAYNSYSIAEIYQSRGNHKLAMLSAEQSHSYALDAKRTGFLTPSQSASLLAVEQAQAGDHDLAQQSIEEAFEYERKGNRGELSIELLIRAAETAANLNETQLALTRYDDAEKAAEKSENAQDLFNVFRSKGLALINADKKAEAEPYLRRALVEAFKYRIQITDQRFHIGFLEATQDVFDALTNLCLSQGRAAEAFDLCEKAHARTMLEQVAGDEEPLTLDKYKAKAAGNINLLLCSVTSTGVNLFLAKKSGIDVGHSTYSSDEIARLVGDYVFEVQNKYDLAVLSQKATLLYQELIKPIEHFLDPDATLCIVPDKALHSLPFASLIDQSGHYLIESRPIIYAPSASILVKCLDQAKQKGISADKMIAVGNPAFDQSLYPNLERLPNAEEEANKSALCYHGQAIIGENATEERVREEMKTASIIHIASHCNVEAGSPWLVLAPSPGRGGQGSAQAGNKDDPTDGNLYLDEVYKLKLPNARLVVLSSCESGLGRYYRGEGMVSLVRPFIAAGVPRVVASMWKVDSGKTATLMTKFHQVLTSEKKGPGDALREAQRKMINDDSTKHPYYWAAFIAEGSN